MREVELRGLVVSVLPRVKAHKNAHVVGQFTLFIESIDSVFTAAIFAFGGIPALLFQIRLLRFGMCLSMPDQNAFPNRFQ